MSGLKKYNYFESACKFGTTHEIALTLSDKSFLMITHSITVLA